MPQKVDGNTIFSQGGDVAPSSDRPRGISNIPIGEPRYFMGRGEELHEIHRRLGQQQGRVAIAALHALRGVGTTVLAPAFGERHRAEYRAAWWVRAATEPGIRSDLQPRHAELAGLAQHRGAGRDRSRSR